MNIADKPRRKSRVALVGAGKIGDAIAHLLRQSGDYDVLVLDQSEARLQLFRSSVSRRCRSTLRNRKVCR